MDTSIRQQITQIVTAIHPLDAQEKAQQSATLDWIASGAALFRIEKPKTPPMHLVSYFIPVDLTTKKLLLVHHKKANLWLPPGGHVEVNEHPTQTVMREMKEELQDKAILLAANPLFLTVTQTVNDPSPHIDVSLWFIVQGNSAKDYIFDTTEFYRVQWFAFTEVPQKHIEPHLPRFMQKLKLFLNRDFKVDCRSN